jgi:Holliday junction DNA helicase RuvB
MGIIAGLIALYLIWAIYQIFQSSHPTTIDIELDLPVPDKYQDKIDVNIVEPVFNADNINSYNHNKKFIFRPETLEQYIGQDKVKNLVRLNIKKIQQMKAVNVLISGNRGHGKTTLARIISNMLHADFLDVIASQISQPDQIIEYVNKINSNPNYTVLFLDEIHSLSPKIAEWFYPVMEDYKLCGKTIKPFTLIGATTEKNILQKKSAPFVDRFQVQLDLEEYTAEEIIDLLQQYKAQLYPIQTIEPLAYRTIADNCKYTPRIAITLLEDVLLEPDIKTVLKYHRIVKDGLTEKDMEILSFLCQNNKPVGEKALAQATGISNADYSEIYEPYLVRKQYVLRGSRGRIIGEKGKEVLI